MIAKCMFHPTTAICREPNGSSVFRRIAPWRQVFRSKSKTPFAYTRLHLWWWQILFRYCSEAGALIDEANPNGAVRNIAGIRNKRGNVFGMMPHPERAADAELQNIDGKLIFKSILQLIKV